MLIGSVTVIVIPAPVSLVTTMSAPRSRHRRRQVARLKPVPPGGKPDRDTRLVV
jgi:hypothetical protein